MDLKRYQQLKREAERSRSEAERARGALDQLLARLESEFGCKDLAGAKKKRAELAKRAEKLMASYDAKVVEFDRKWGDVQ